MMKESENIINEFSYFTEVHKTFVRDGESWLLQKLKEKEGKDDDKSKELRCLGNDSFAKKEYRSCYYYYTKSLCYAKKGSENYGLALANRSALLYELGDYGNCIKDIELCLESKYPKRLQPKILLRKCHCLYKEMGKSSPELEECINLALNIVEICGDIPPDQRDIYKQKLCNVDSVAAASLPQNLEYDYTIPPLKGEENKSFASASSSIEMRYNKDKGRYVVAVENLKCGDVLFVEKSFFFAPVFAPDSEEFPLDKCYHCLKNLRSSVPCPTCTLCVYCDESCRQNSWSAAYHKWECVGMQTNIWYELGIAFAAFKAVCKGLPSKFAETNTDEPSAKFGDKKDNYPYFNSLLSHISSSDHLDSMALLASKVVVYLKQCTTFFEDLQPLFSCENAVEFIGGLILRHMGQIACNASIIEHWCSNESGDLPEKSTPVACGMFPSISIMNHSCKPNITVFYVSDIAVVKALEDIDENEEILNCYGIDYRYMDRKSRQRHCRNIYHFACNCVICSDAMKEFDLLDNLRCPNCGQEFQSDIPFNSCSKCKKLLNDISRLENEAYDLLDEDLKLNLILQSQKIGVKIFSKNHMYFTRLYEAFYVYYLENADVNNALKFIQLLKENESARMGNNSRSIAVKLYKIVREIITCVKFNGLDAQEFENEMQLLKKHCVLILQLYYPYNEKSIHESLFDKFEINCI